MDPARRAFYEYHASLMEPWDGPASMTFTDGTIIGAVLDRNGLRPSRIWVTEDGLVVMASEAGVLDLDPSKVVRRMRLQPGRMFLVDTAQGRIVADEEIKAELAAEQPYQEWLDNGLITAGRAAAGRLRADARTIGLCCGSWFSVTPTRSSTCWSRRWPEPAPSRSARWAPTPRSRCSPSGRGCCSTTSSSCSPR